MSSQPRISLPPASEVLAAPSPPLGEALPALDLEKGRNISTARAYWGLAFFLLFLAALFLPLRYPGYFDPLYRLPQFNRFMALALFALSVDMIWGYTGLLSLGQGLYFGIGAYIVAWSLKLQKAAMDASEATDPRVDRYILGPGVMPDYMMQCRLDAVPDWIAPLINIWVALPLAILLPTILAFAFGFIVFKRRIKGVYFSLITQALVLAIFYLVSNQRPYTGGVDGQNTLSGLELFGIDFEDSKSMFYLVTGILVVFAFLCYVLVHSKFGKILTAIRDNEFRVMALGYNTAMFKTFVFALSGLMAGLAGALFVAANQTASPTFFSISDSIEVVIFVAVGGRGTLVGAIFGALLVNWGKDYINNAFSTWWPVVLGGLFVAVVLFLPEGIVGGVPRFFKFVRVWFYRRPGLSTSWNSVRIAVGLLYWGIVSVCLAGFVLVVAGIITRRETPATTEELFAGLVGSISYWLLLGGSLMAFVGQCVCSAVPSDTRTKRMILGSIVSLALFLAVGFLAVPAPLGDFRHIFGLGGFGDARTALLVFLGLSVILSHLLLAFFIRGVALFYQHETLAKSAQGFVKLYAIFFVSVVFLNSMDESARNHAALGPFIYLVTLAYVGMLVVLPIWFLRLLFQTHECINRPMAAS
jgi:urea transport system permease protein